MDEMEGRSADGDLLWSVGDEGDGTYSSMASCASDAPVVIALTGSKFEENVVIPRDGKSEDSPALAFLDSRTGAILTYGDKFQVEPLANGEVAIDVSYDSAPDRGTLSVFDSRGGEAVVRGGQLAPERPGGHLFRGAPRRPAEDERE